MKSKINGNPFNIGEDKTKNYSIYPKSNNKWFEIDLFSGQKNDSKKDALGPLISQKAINIWLLILLVGILVLAGRTAYLQLFRGPYFRAVAEGNRIRIRDIKATRGVIYDRYQNLLVENVSTFSLAVVPVDLPENEAEMNDLVFELAKISGKTVEEINSLIDDQSPYSYQPVVIAENLTHDQSILTKILNSRFPGVTLKVDNSRYYLTTELNPSFSHLLGYQGKIEESKLQDYLEQGYGFDDYAGKAGLELFYEKELKGRNGREQVEVDATGEAKEIIAQQEPLAGYNLVLTIDSDLQKQAEDSLRRILGAYGKKRGSVVVLDPNSGEVLAMINWPGFNNNLFSQGISQEDFSELINNPNQPLFTRSISGEYPSGSTFKLIVAAAALEEDIITPQTRFYSTGGIGIKSWFFPDWKAGGHGWTNVVKALAESVNTFFYIIGGGLEDDFDGLGVANIKKYAEMFGLNKTLGIDLPNEASGFLPTKEWKERVKEEVWYIGDTYHLAIGQGDILVTPLQVAAYTSVFANNGTLYQPYLVKELLDKDNNLVREIKPKVLNKDFIGQENIALVNSGLRQAVLTGSAKVLYGLPISVAAKTGTAEWSSKNEPHAWLTAFAPYDNPQIVVTVLVEEGGEGSRVALPVARDIINWWALNR